MDMSIINSNLENELIFSEKSIFLKIVKKLSKIIKESNNLILLKIIYLITQTSNRHYVKFNFFPYKFQIYLYISYRIKLITVKLIAAPINTHIFTNIKNIKNILNFQ